MAGAVTTLSTGDVDAVLGVVAEAAATDADEPFDLALLQRMAAVLHADSAGYFEHGGLRGDDIWVSTHDPELLVPIDEAWAAHRTWPLRDWANTGSATARSASDFLPTRQSRLSNAWYRTILRPCGTEDVIKVWLPSPAGTWRGFFFSREAARGDFGERDRAVLTVLRPHLAGIRARWRLSRPLPLGLTQRELEVLELLRHGMTNQEIGERLVVSTGTVRKHLENVFAKLDVHTRTAAVAHAFGQTQPRRT